MNLNELITDVYDWLNKEVDVERGTKFVRKAEEILSNDLRIADQIVISRATITESMVRLPNNWQELDFIKYLGGQSISLVPREDLADKPSVNTVRNAALTGNYVEFGGSPDNTEGKEVQISYYSDVPAVGDTPTWLTLRHPMLITNAVILVAESFYMDDVRTANAKAYVDETIEKLNIRHNLAKTRGSTLKTAFGRGRS